MVDAYIWGTVNRISPEAPVPVVTVIKKEIRLGGAANVALNLCALGATPILCTVIGKDAAGKQFFETMNNNNLMVEGIMESDDRVTTVKTRVIGSSQQMLRIDDETDKNLSSSATFCGMIESILHRESINAIIIEDYDKGVITPELITRITAVAKEKNIPVAADPKKKNFLLYKGVTLFKPNLRELKEGLKLDSESTNMQLLQKKIAAFRQKQNIKILLLTLSDKGIYFSSDNGSALIPAHVRNIADVSGAGDTVISVAALCLALGLPAKTMAELANLAGGLVCENVGVVPVTKEELINKWKEINNSSANNE